MADQRRGGTIQLKINGEIFDAKGDFTYNLGRAKREAIVGADRIHGYKETPQVGFIEGVVTDRGTLDFDQLVSARDVTVSLELANGKLIMLREAWFAGDGAGTTGEGELAVRWEGECEEVPA